MASDLVLCIDPGLRACGVALFDTDGRLRRAGLPQNAIRKERGPRAWNGMAQAVWAWYEGLRIGYDPDHVRVEGQVVDSRTPNANDMLEVSGVAGACAALWLDSQISSPGAPENWKSSIDKKAMTERIRGRILESPAEWANLDNVPESLRHNMFDAVGIGLKYFGRLEPRKVIAR